MIFKGHEWIVTGSGVVTGSRRKYFIAHRFEKKKILTAHIPAGRSEKKKQSTEHEKNSRQEILDFIESL